MSINWRTDFYHYYETELVYFRVLRNGTEIGRVAAFTSDGGAAWLMVTGGSSLTIEDISPSAGSNIYTVQYWMANTYGSFTETLFLKERYLSVAEIRP
jgi:hypothetical protein